MSLYFLASLACSFLTLGVLAYTLIFKRHMAVKPSMWLLGFFHIQIQWAATVNAEDITSFLSRPWDFFILTQMFPLIGSIGSVFIGESKARELWTRIVNTPDINYSSYAKEMALLLVMTFAFLGIYFMFVPFSNVGLITTLTSGSWELAREDRELSYKLLENPFVRYSYAINSGFIAPMLAVLATISGAVMLKRMNFIVIPLFMGIILFAMITASLNGARGPAGMVVMACMLALFFYKRLPVNPVYAILAILCILSLPTIMAVVRTGDMLTMTAVSETFLEKILSRVFYIPMQTGVYHCDYVQGADYWGVAGISKLAPFFGVQPEPVNNIIGLTYGGSSLATVNMNTSYVFSYYTFFGLIAFPVTLLLLWALDGLLYVYQHFGIRILLPAIIVCNLIVRSLIGREYTTMFVTGGLVPGLLILFVINQLFPSPKYPPTVHEPMPVDVPPPEDTLVQDIKI